MIKSESLSDKDLTVIYTYRCNTCGEMIHLKTIKK